MHGLYQLGDKLSTLTERETMYTTTQKPYKFGDMLAALKEKHPEEPQRFARGSAVVAWESTLAAVKATHLDATKVG